MSAAWLRLLPVVFVIAASALYVFHVEGHDAYAWRNVLPMAVTLLLAAVALARGHGRYSGSGYCWPLAATGFAIPALGLSLYLHHGYAVDLNGMYSEAIFPLELFRYLPVYTMFAGAIGFAIGWIVGRNV